MRQLLVLAYLLRLSLRYCIVIVMLMVYICTVFCDYWTATVRIYFIASCILFDKYIN